MTNCMPFDRIVVHAFSTDFLFRIYFLQILIHFIKWTNFTFYGMNLELFIFVFMQNLKPEETYIKSEQKEQLYSALRVTHL